MKLSRNYKPLLALCRAHYGLYLLNQTNRFDPAAQMMAAARKEFGAETPVPFQIFTLCREADALRYAKKWRLSDDRFGKALRLTTIAKVGPGEAHPLTAAAWKHFAWSCREECRIKDARAAFERSARILSRVEKKVYDDTVIDRLHIKHGLAMVERFQGRNTRALEAYRRLTHEIAEEISNRDDNAQERANYAEIRFLLYDRLINSLERQADCSLFGDLPDYAEAADDYRRAIRESTNLPEDWWASTQVDLLYRRSIALSLPSDS